MLTPLTAQIIATSHAECSYIDVNTAGCIPPKSVAFYESITDKLFIPRRSTNYSPNEGINLCSVAGFTGTAV